MIQQTLINQNLTTTSENCFFNYNIDYLTKFNGMASNINYSSNCLKISLNFGFKEIKFEKKQMILYFFLMECFTHQKCTLTFSKKNLINLKIKRGSITGCKLTLRKQNLQAFLETLILGLPRSEIFNGLLFKKNSLKKQSYSTKLKNLFIFYTLESDILPTINSLDITFNFNT